MSIESLSISKPFFELKFIQNENSYIIKSPSILINLSNVKISIKDQLLSKYHSLIVKNIKVTNIKKAVLVVLNNNEDDKKIMSNWALIIYCGLITYLTRFSMIALIKKEMFNDRIREVLSYVPSSIFPAIIFPAIFLDNSVSFFPYVFLSWFDKAGSFFRSSARSVSLPK